MLYAFSPQMSGALLAASQLAPAAEPPITPVKSTMWIPQLRVQPTCRTTHY